jgi:hypothetical protein
MKGEVLMNEKSIVRKLATFPFTLYKIFISPLIPPSCLYRPTCSEYFRESIMRFGIIKGHLLGLMRLLRCNAWFFRGGEDPVPEYFSFKAAAGLFGRFRKNYIP